MLTLCMTDLCLQTACLTLVNDALRACGVGSITAKWIRQGPQHTTEHQFIQTLQD